MKLVSFFSGRTLRTTTVAQALEGCGKIPPPLAVEAVEGMLPANATTTSGLRQRRLRGLELPSITNHQTLIPRSSVTAGQAHQQPLLSLISLTIRWVKVTSKLSSYSCLSNKCEVTLILFWTFENWISPYLSSHTYFFQRNLKIGMTIESNFVCFSC